jgi:site-specific recombinase
MTMEAAPGNARPETAKPPRAEALLSAKQVREVVLNALPADTRSSAAAREVAADLADFISTDNLAIRLNAFVALKEWTTADLPSPNSRDTTRLRTMLTLMDSNDVLCAGFQRAISKILHEVRSVTLFAEAGLHPREGLWSEAARRLVRHILPSAREDTDLAKLVSRLYPTDQSIERLVNLPDEVFERIVRILSPLNDTHAWENQKDDLTQAFHLLGVHVAGIGLAPAMRSRSHQETIEESPFYQLQQATAELARVHGAAPALEDWRQKVHHCRSELNFVHHRMEDTGVSTSLVFDIGTIERAIARMESIADVLFSQHAQNPIHTVKRLLDDVMSARREDMSLRALFAENTALMARKVVERTGEAGEHYIANSPKEYKMIWWASLGGGLLTVLTAAIKMRIVEAEFPPFVEGMAAGTNYAVSFILLQIFHLALATKQPSVTAATFAGIVRTTHGKARLEKVSEFVSRITRSQLASAAGNLLAVCAGCVVFAALWHWIFGRPFLEVGSADHVYHSLDPIGSGTMFYAALTGVILWISALAGGWVENFATYNSVPEAIAQHRLGLKVGRERMKKVAETVDANISGWATSIVLGYLLGFVPAMGKFFGVPLDVRHVTLSTGTLALAAASLGRNWVHEGWFINTLFGIAFTFVLNLGVSFSIAASVAMNAYGVPRHDQLRLWKYTALRFLKSPRNFLLPPAVPSSKLESDLAGGEQAQIAGAQGNEMTEKSA